MQAVTGSAFPNTVTPFVAASRPIAPNMSSASQALTATPVEQTGVVVSLANHLGASSSPVYQKPVSVALKSESSAPVLSVPTAPEPIKPPPEGSVSGASIPQEKPVTQRAGNEREGSAAEAAPAPEVPASGQGAPESGSTPEAPPSVAPPPGGSTPGSEANNTSKASQSDSESPGSSPSVEDNSVGLTVEERELVSQLAARDQEVRTHELQHQSVGGQHAGSARFTYETGPDGVQYAVGGEVSISVSEVPNDPQATIDKMRTIRAAALAPAEPSSQDRSVAAQASRLTLNAQAELSKQSAEGREQLKAEQAEKQKERLANLEAAKGDRAENSQSTRSNTITYEAFIQAGKHYKDNFPAEPNLLDVVV